MPEKVVPKSMPTTSLWLLLCVGPDIGNSILSKDFKFTMVLRVQDLFDESNNCEFAVCSVLKTVGTLPCLNKQGIQSCKYLT